MSQSGEDNSIVLRTESSETVDRRLVLLADEVGRSHPAACLRPFSGLGSNE